MNGEIVRGCDAGRFVVLPKRGIVEGAIARLNRCRRRSKDWECLNRNAPAFLRWASVGLMLRWLSRAGRCSGTDSESLENCFGHDAYHRGFAGSAVILSATQRAPGGA